MTESVYSHHTRLVRKPLRYGHRSRNTGLVKFNTSVLKLGQCLDEISRIRPKPRMICRNHHITSLACKSGKPFHLFPAWRRIFTCMRIRACDHHSIPTVHRHHAPQGIDSFRIDISHIAFSLHVRFNPTILLKINENPVSWRTNCLPDLNLRTIRQDITSDYFGNYTVRNKKTVFRNTDFSGRSKDEAACPEGVVKTGRVAVFFQESGRYAV